MYMYIALLILLQERGYQFHIKGEPCTFYGTSAIVSANNPASCAIGGFKESVSALLPCRHCLGPNQIIRQEV